MPLDHSASAPGSSSWPGPVRWLGPPGHPWPAFAPPPGWSLPPPSTSGSPPMLPVTNISLENTTQGGLIELDKLFGKFGLGSNHNSYLSNKHAIC